MSIFRRKKVWIQAKVFALLVLRFLVISKLLFPQLSLKVLSFVCFLYSISQYQQPTTDWGILWRICFSYCVNITHSIPLVIFSSLVSIWWPWRNFRNLKDFTDHTNQTTYFISEHIQLIFFRINWNYFLSFTLKMFRCTRNHK